jgi:hypothetical protein
MPLLDLLVCAISAALAYLAHGAAGFTVLLLAFFSVPWQSISRRDWRRVVRGVFRGLLAGLVFLAILLPWLWYQNYYDPPGNQLLKMHLAGAGPDNRPFLETLSRAYRNTNVPTLLNNRWENLRVLFVQDTGVFYGAPQISARDYQLSRLGWRGFCNWWRLGEFHTLLIALGLLNLGLPVFVFRVVTHRPDADRGFAVAATQLLPFALANILLWAVLLFGPATTVLHHGRYAAFLLLFAGLAGSLASLRRLWMLLVIGIQVAWFAMIWIIESLVNAEGRANYLMFAMVILFAICLLSLINENLTPANVMEVKRS